MRHRHRPNREHGRCAAEGRLDPPEYIEHIFVASTKHITKEAAIALNWPESIAGMVIIPRAYGWFIHIPTDRDDFNAMLHASNAAELGTANFRACAGLPVKRTVAGLC